MLFNVVQYRGYCITYNTAVATVENKQDFFEFARAETAKLLGPTWGPPGSCRPQMGPMLAPWTFLSGRKILWWKKKRQINTPPSRLCQTENCGKSDEFYSQMCYWISTSAFMATKVISLGYMARQFKSLGMKFVMSAKFYMTGSNPMPWKPQFLSGLAHWGLDKMAIIFWVYLENHVLIWKVLLLKFYRILFK